ncbi:MAG: MBG domain-containing protein, partial [Terriglobia bacterium]
MALGADGRIYITGTYTNSMDFPTTPGAEVPACPAPLNYGGVIYCLSTFVAAIDPSQSGSASLVYSTYLGGSWTGDPSYYDRGHGIAVDSLGNAYVTGGTFSADFPTTPGAYLTTCPSNASWPCYSAYLTKFDSTGKIAYSTYLPGFGGTGIAVAVDSSRNAFLLGIGYAGFPTTPDALHPACPLCTGQYDTFITEVNPAGSDVVYSSYLTGLPVGNWYGSSLALDNQGSLYVAGGVFEGYPGIQFPTSPGAFQTQGTCKTFNCTDSFVMKLGGFGSPPAVSLSPASLDFGHIQVGTQSVAQSVTVTNSGNAPLHVTTASATGDFIESDDCTSAPIAPGNHCTVDVSFLPTALGPRTGTLSLTDDAAGSPHTVSLTGIGDPDSKTVDISAPPVTYPSNGSVTVSVTSGAATVTGNVSLSVDGNPQPAQALSSGSAVFTISGLSAGPHNLGATYAAQGNFAASSATGTLIVNKANASVTPATAGKTYGTADPALTGTLSGFVPADNVTATYSRTAGETVAGGPYSISATLSPASVLGNYNITYNTASFTINQANASVTPNPAGKTYGTADPTITGMLSGFLAADTVNASYSRTAGETVAGSPYTISATLSPASVLGNYNITYNTANFTITPAPLTITANSKSKVFGAPLPTLDV